MTLSRNVVATLSGAWAGLVFLGAVIAESRENFAHTQSGSYQIFVVLLMGIPFIAVMFGPEFLRIFKAGMLNDNEMRAFISSSFARFFYFLGGGALVYGLDFLVLL